MEIDFSLMPLLAEKKKKGKIGLNVYVLFHIAHTHQ